MTHAHFLTRRKRLLNLIGDGVATAVSGGSGGSGVTTYAENIGVMAATRVFSTAAYWVAAIAAVLAAVFMSYRQPELMIDLANRFWSCF